MRSALAGIVLAVLSGCSDAAPTAETTDEPTVAAATPSPGATLQPVPTASATNDTVLALPGPSDKDPQALLAYWRSAVEAGYTAAAAKAWRSGIAPATMPAGNGAVRVAFGEGQTEGAAGSSYFTVPITITVGDGTGQPVANEGTLTARRVNDVDGASAEQLSWRIVAIDWR